jgi:hypothetical protein
VSAIFVCVEFSSVWNRFIKDRLRLLKHSLLVNCNLHLHM